MNPPIQRRKRTIKSPKKQGTVKRADVERVVRRHLGEEMKLKDTRPYRAGEQVGKALAETANILYLLDNRVEYLTGIWEVVRESLAEAIKEQARKQREKELFDKSLQPR